MIPPARECVCLCQIALRTFKTLDRNSRELRRLTGMEFQTQRKEDINTSLGHDREGSKMDTVQLYNHVTCRRWPPGTKDSLFLHRDWDVHIIIGRLF